MRRLSVLVVVLAACGTQPQPTKVSSPPPFDLGERVQEAGEVVEVVQAGSYTYLHYELENHQTRWLATLRTDAEAGDSVQVVRYASRRDFHSARLDRDFPLLHFGRIIKETDPMRVRISGCPGGPAN